MSVKSKLKISNSLLALLGENSFQEITVAEICAWSNVSRGTFYNNFQSKEDVISFASHRMITQYMNDFISGDEHFVQEMAYYYFRLSKEQKDYLDLLTRHNLYHLHRNQLLNVVSLHSKVKNQPALLCKSEKERVYTTLAYISSAMAIYEEWAQGGFVESTLEITKIFLSIIYHPSQKQADEPPTPAGS